MCTTIECCPIRHSSSHMANRLYYMLLPYFLYYTPGRLIFKHGIHVPTRRKRGTGIYSWAILMYWSLLSCSNQQTVIINTRISAFVACEAFLLYSAVGNVVVCSGPTIRATRKLSETIGEPVGSRGDTGSIRY